MLRPRLASSASVNRGASACESGIGYIGCPFDHGTRAKLACTLHCHTMPPGVSILELTTRGGKPVSPTSAAAAFRTIDTDKSGAVNFDEFCVWAVHQQVGKPPSHATTGRR